MAPQQDFHFIAVPNAQASQQIARLKSSSASSPLDNLATVSTFNFPQFKVGTLASLISTADDLQKADSVVEVAVNKLADTIGSLLEGRKDQIKSALLINDKPVEVFVQEFAWNAIKYRSDKPVKEIADSIMAEVNSIDGVVKTKLNAYSATKSSLLGMERKQTGSLAVKSLADVVTRDAFVTDSEYLKTVLVVVPKSAVADFLASYERMASMVVPRSANKLAQDEEFSLYGVVVFQRVMDEFASKCREMKLILRDFTVDDTAIAGEKKEMADLGVSAKEQWALLVRLCKSNFGEVFAAWIHLKALRVFVEAVLRYGLPPDFQALCVHPRLKQEKKVMDTLSQLFAPLGNSIAGGSGKGDQEASEMESSMAGLDIGKDSYYPFVNFDLKISWE